MSKDVEGFRGMMWGWVKKSLSFGTATATGSIWIFRVSGFGHFGPILPILMSFFM
jgi:hypothetical protein